MYNSIEKNFVIGIVGDNFEYRNLIGQALGSPDTKSDILFYSRLDGNLNQVFSALTPIDYPEKIKPFLQTLIISNIHVLVIDLDAVLNSIVGEMLVGLDLFHQLFDTRVLIVITNITSKTEWKLTSARKKIEAILRTTSLKDSDIFEIRQKEDYNLLKIKIVELGLTFPISKSEEVPYVKILIDHAFPVKGIGTVILGIVKRGTINAGQMLELTGNGAASKKIIIRSIQKFDRDFKSACEGDRVGLALKGNILPNEISRDNLLVTQGSFIQETKIKATVFINQFYIPKNLTIKPGDNTQYYGIVELKLTPIKFIEGDEITPGKSGVITLSFDKPLFHDGTGLKGIITEMNKFNNKLRIVGYFIQLK
jgi:selenocysteine-specific elongation factor